MRLFIRAFLLTVPVVLLAASCGDDDSTKPARAATYTLYFSQDDNGNGLYKIDTTTGVGTLAGSGVSGVTSSTVGLAYRASDDALYGSRYASLLKIELDGSGATDLGGIGNEALAFDNDSGILYGTINGAFRSINPADGTQAVDLADPGADVEGLAVDPETGIVYGVTRGAGSVLMAYDIVTNTWSTVGSLGMTVWDPGLAYHPVQKKLYMVEGETASIYTINKADATVTLVGAHGISGNGGGGLAFAMD